MFVGDLIRVLDEDSAIEIADMSGSLWSGNYYKWLNDGVPNATDFVWTIGAEGRDKVIIMIVN